MKPFLKRLNERGEALPAAIVTALISAIILLGAAGMVSYVVQGKTTAEKATLADTTFASIESQFKTDLTKASKLQPISSTEFRIHTVFQNPANAAQNHCKLINWKVTGNKLERTITFYKGTNPTDVTDCTNSDTMIVSKGTKTLTHKLDAADTTFNFQNGLGRELSVVGGAVGFKNPNSCPLNDEMSATDPECKPVEASVKHSWNLAKPEKVDYVLSINNKQRSLTQAPTLALYSNVNPEGTGMGSTALEAVHPTTLRGPANVFVNVPFNLSWDAADCPADTVRSYTLLRDGVAVATTDESSIDAIVPAMVDNARFSVVVNCARGELLVNSDPSNEATMGVSIAPPTINLAAIANGAPVNVAVATTADECAFGTFTWNVARTHDSYQALNADSTVTGTGRLSARLNSAAAAFEGTEYQLRVNGTCADSVSGKSSAEASANTNRFTTRMSLPTISTAAFTKTSYSYSELATVQLNVTVNTCPASWTTEVTNTKGRVNFDNSQTAMWGTATRSMGDHRGAAVLEQFAYSVPNTEPSAAKGVFGSVSKLSCVRGSERVEGTNLGRVATATHRLLSPSAATLTPVPKLPVNATSANLSWSAVTCNPGFTAQYQLLETRKDGATSSNILQAFSPATTAKTPVPAFMTMNSYRVDAKCVGSNPNAQTAVAASGVENVNITTPMMRLTANCPAETNLEVPVVNTFNGTVTWEYGSKKVVKNLPLPLGTAFNNPVPANTPVTVTIEGVAGSKNFDRGLPTNASKNCYQSVDAWDNELGYTSAYRGFSGYHNLTKMVAPPKGIVDMSFMLYNTPSFNDSVADWDTSNVTNMASLFAMSSSFNQPVSHFNTSKVTNMNRMFGAAAAFNQPVPFDTRNVTDMSSMFAVARAFNQPVNFNTANVTDMASMFQSAVLFNQPVSHFNTSKVTDMSSMFHGNAGVKMAFNQPVNFNTTNVTSMRYMFAGANVLNKPLGTTFTSNTGKVTDMSQMFHGAKAFNQPVPLNTASVKDMSKMFAFTDTFNQPLSFNTANVTNMSSMFESALAFNQPVNFNTANVTDMKQMFMLASTFNKPFGTAFTSNTGKVTDMSQMFRTARAFNQPVPFNTASATNMSGMFNTAAVFNQPVNFNSVNVTDMSSMFEGHNASNTNTAFNKPVTLNTTNVKNMSSMFKGAVYFNQPVNFNTANVTDMSEMFHNSKVFNQPVNFNTANVTNMKQMFMLASAFNKPLGTAFTSNTGKVTDMSQMFANANVFNQQVPLNTASVTNMSQMFNNAGAFNQPVNFNSVNVTDMSSMFEGHVTMSVGNSVFNQPVTLNTTNVTNMSKMFKGAKLFNRPVAFNTAKVANMSEMFNEARAFNQDLSKLDTSKLTAYTNYRKFSAMDNVTAKWLKVNGVSV